MQTHTVALVHGRTHMHTRSHRVTGPEYQNDKKMREEKKRKEKTNAAVTTTTVTTATATTLMANSKLLPNALLSVCKAVESVLDIYLS